MEEDIKLINTDIVLCDGLFSLDELDSIQSICNLYLKKIGGVTTITGDNQSRKSDYFYMPREFITKFIYNKMTHAAKKINEEYFKFDILGAVSEGFLYLGYNQPGDHFDWHIDNSQNFRSSKEPVKMILVLQLSDPSEYEGGDAEVAGTGITIIPKKKGLIWAIPGYTAHRVTPLKFGNRSILSCWFTGPCFK